jgi:hypothetical protein
MERRKFIKKKVERHFHNKAVGRKGTHWRRERERDGYSLINLAQTRVTL